VGLGAMGFGMANNLVNKGYDVVAYDIAEAPVQRLVQRGARGASSIAELGAECQQVMVMVVNGEQVEAVTTELAETMRNGTVLVNSTIALSDLRRIAAMAQGQGLKVIDCPVSGGVTGADAGTLTMLCGGDLDAFNAHRHLLEAVCSNITHLGPLGAGMVGKLANNLILGVGRLAIAEAFAMANKAGISTEMLYQTMLTCTADSKQLRGLEGVLVRGEYPERTFLGLKDLDAAVTSGRAVDQAMPMTALARELYQLANDKMGGLNGSDEVMRYLLDN
ncbi:MAG: NAD(P)-dependent oxidoreductase, partial [Gammaproteobacteria bacterium]|nr:NAD(P)-dependent oxidoreductase [Gammaproteobacteria bacterium]